MIHFVFMKAPNLFLKIQSPQLFHPSQIKLLNLIGKVTVYLLKSSTAFGSEKNIEYLKANITANKQGFYVYRENRLVAMPDILICLKWTHIGQIAELH